MFTSPKQSTDRFMVDGPCHPRSQGEALVRFAERRHGITHAQVAFVDVVTAVRVEQPAGKSQAVRKTFAQPGRNVEQLLVQSEAGHDRYPRTDTEVVGDAVSHAGKHEEMIGEVPGAFRERSSGRGTPPAP